MHVVSSDPSLIAKEVNNLILSNTRYEGNNNFWQENQTILRKFDQLNLAYIRDEVDKFIKYLDDLFGKDTMKECKEVMNELKKRI